MKLLTIIAELFGLLNAKPENRNRLDRTIPHKCIAPPSPKTSAGQSGARAEAFHGARTSGPKASPVGLVLVGVHDAAFRITGRIEPLHKRMRAPLQHLANELKATPQLNLAAGLDYALEILFRSPKGRMGIILITSGPSVTKPVWMRELVQEATRKRIGIHVIQIGHTSPGATQQLAGISTKASLGFGELHLAHTTPELCDALRSSLDALMPVRTSRGSNTAVLVLDCSMSMTDRFESTTRMEAFAAAFHDYLRNSFDRPFVDGRQQTQTLTGSNQLSFR